MSLGRCCEDQLLQLVRAHAVVVAAGTRDELGLVAGEGLERGEVAGVLDQRPCRPDPAARLRHQIDALLRAAGDQHLLGARGDAAARPAGPPIHSRRGP